MSGCGRVATGDGLQHERQEQAGAVLVTSTKDEYGGRAEAVRAGGAGGHEVGMVTGGMTGLHHITARLDDEVYGSVRRYGAG